MGSWQEMDHTADLAIRVCAANLSDLFSTACEAMMALAAVPENRAPTVSVEIALDAVDTEALLIDWLNEVLHLHALEGAVVTDVAFVSISRTALKAQVRGVPVKEYRENIKAATYHDIEIVEERDVVCTQIVFDV